MKRRYSIPAMVCSCILIALVSTPAEAATYKVVRSKTSKAYDYNNYKARLYPSGYSIPSGYISAGQSLNVKQGKRFVARGKTSYAASSGTYTVYSTIKYRKKTAYTAYYGQAVTGNAYSCSVSSSQITSQPDFYDDGYGNISWYGYLAVDYYGYCYGAYYSGDSYDEYGNTILGRTSYGQFWGSWSESDYIDTSSESEWRSTILSAGSTRDWSCDYTTYLGACGSYGGPSGSFDISIPYTAYRYGPVLKKLTQQVVTVVKKNSPYITRGEWNSLRSGMTPSRIKGIFGNGGYLYSVDGNRTVRAYTDTRADGSYCSTYFLGFRSGKLSAWLATQWGCYA